jgi:DNA-binding MarR family transcriptional regulator
MTQNTLTDDDVRACLHTIGVESQCQWDLLIFLSRHRTTLMSPESLARLVGYRCETVTTALDSLEALHLVTRVGSHGARLYDIMRVAPPRRAALERLLAMSDVREGRIIVWRHLRRDRSPQEGLETARRFVADAKRVAQIASDRSREIREVVRERRRRADANTSDGTHEMRGEAQASAAAVNGAAVRRR